MNEIINHAVAAAAAAIVIINTIGTVLIVALDLIEAWRRRYYK